MGDVRAPWTRRLAGLGMAAAAALAVATATAVPAAAEGTILGAGRPDAIKDSYLVVIKDSASPRSAAPQTAKALADQYGGTVKDVWQHAVNGFAAQMTEKQARRMAADKRVVHVEQDATVHLAATQTPTPSWGLDRIDQRNLPLNNSYTYPNTASNVTAYVIDTGIRITHNDFGGRAVWGTNTTGDGNNSDCNGHGTHVAGTIGGAAYGVAKGVRLVAVKVLGCTGSGSFTGIVNGVNWVTGNHTSGPAVANMSLGGSGSNATLENAVRNSIADGVVYALASGNSSSDACNFTPARTPEAITVNATQSNDARASFSNFGTCTDIFAPGVSITSAWHTSNTATNTISGTSMAAPHVAGAAALHLSANPTATPAAVASAMFAAATPNIVTNPGTGSPNRLLFVGSGSPQPPGCAPATNGTDVAIPDLATVQSSITISGCSGNASASSTIEVHIIHTYIGDLVVDLIAPDGTVYNLHNRSGGSADNIHTTYSRNLSGEVANGTWRLRVRDAASFDTGRIDSWTLDI
jgi:subtilisin family serine protease